MIFNCRQSTADGKVAYWGAELDEDYARLDIHDSYELIYVKSGVCRLNYQAHEIEITAGKAFLLFPNTLHFTQCVRKTALAYNIVFPKYLVEEFNEAVKDKCPL
ncbi:MAG: AraC family ligand binding domain-containing protein, partial [Acutalibacteraceae bacterium]